MHRLVNLKKRFAQPGVHACTCLGQPHAKAFTFQQDNSQAVFQHADLLAYGAGGDVQGLRCGLDAFALPNLYECAQRLQGITHIYFRFSKFIKKK